MDIYAKLAKPFTASFSTVIYQTEDCETLLTGTNFHWFFETVNHFKVENSDGLFEFRMKPMKTPRRSLLAKLLGDRFVGLHMQATAVNASSGKQIRVTRQRMELVVEDLDADITVTGRTETPRRWFARGKHVLRSSLGNSIVMEEQAVRLKDIREALSGEQGMRIAVFDGERAEDWNLLFLALFAYCTILMPFYEID